METPLQKCRRLQRDMSKFLEESGYNPMVASMLLQAKEAEITILRIRLTRNVVRVSRGA